MWWKMRLRESKREPEREREQERRREREEIAREREWGREPLKQHQRFILDRKTEKWVETIFRKLKVPSLGLDGNISKNI